MKTGIGTKALERVLRKLGQRKVASGKYTMIVDNMNSSRLLSPVIGAIYGSSIQQKNSFLLDKIDQKVASDKMTLIDEPHLVKASGARYFGIRAGYIENVLYRYVFRQQDGHGTNDRLSLDSYHAEW